MHEIHYIYTKSVG